MKKIASIIIIFCMIAFVFNGCTTTVIEDTFEISVTTEDIIKTAPLVFLGKVKAEGEGWYRNAKKVYYYDDGHAMFNYWITPYTVEVLEVYKGDLKEEVTELTLGTYNEKSPTEKKVEEEEPFYLETGDTAIFCVSYKEVDGCYAPIYGKKGTFFPSAQKNIYVSYNNSLDVTDMENALKKAEISGTDRAAIAGEKVDIKSEHKKQAAKNNN